MGETGSAAELPALIRSFAERARASVIVPSAVRLRQMGEMRLAPGRAWYRFTAEQQINVHAPGFVWRAHMRRAPLVSVHVLDAYEAGEGSLEARLLGWIRLARAAGAAVSRGELMRYLAELPWAPAAMLYNPQLRWRETEASVVEVEAESSGGPVRVRLVFDDGDIVRTEADDRPRAVGTHFVPTAWAGRFFEYRDFNGWRIPTRAEAGWRSDGEFLAYWRGRITDYQVC